MASFSSRRFRNAPTESGTYSAEIALARIINVHYKSYTVDVSIDHNGTEYENVQVGMPYFHYEAGEGIYVMPEVGAQCVVAVPSESGDPFVLCFLGLMQSVTPGEKDGPQTPEDVEDQAEDIEEGEAEEDENLDLTYQNNRPLMRPGDIMMAGRDRNFLVLRRGGIVQVGSTAIAQRMYIPVRNFIKDFAENYQMDLAGGRMSWEVLEETESAHRAVQRFVWREYAEHAKGSLKCEIGEVGDNYLEFTMAPELIDMKTGEVQGDTLLRFVFSKQGEQIIECQKQTITVEGDRIITIQGKHEESCKSYSQVVDNKRTVKFSEERKEGTRSVEDVDTKEIKASSIKLGGDSPAVKGRELMAFLRSVQLTVDPVTSTARFTFVPDTIISSKVKLG